MVKRNEDVEAAWGTYATAMATALRRARLRSGLSQEETAYRAGLTRYTYQKYEKGESRPGRPANPSVRSLLAISQVLETEISALLPADEPDLRTR